MDMYKINKKALYAIPLIAAVTLSACQKFLDVEPRASISDKQTIFDASSAETALNGVYGSFYYGTSFESIGYLSGDNIQWTGSHSSIQEFINHHVSAENENISGAWDAIYSTVNRANNVISKVPQVTDPSLSDSLKNQITGEAYFIRALAYFDLARTWGGVPLITEPTTSPADNIGIPRSSQQETYAQVLKDLNTAEPLLPETTDRYRATRKTVWALKARYYLYQKDWKNAEAYADKLINDSANYRLIKPYGSFFQNNVQANQEAVFYIFHSSSEPNGERGSWQPQQNGGTRQWAPNDAFVALVNNPAIGGNRNVLVAQDNQGRWYGNLYYRSDGSDPNYIIRIAELYLIRAEARAQQNNLSGALQDLDAVRDRAGLEKSTASTQADILLAIENERRIEFSLEPHRWYDLVRTGRAGTVLGIKDADYFLMPIPADQLLADKALEQNHGY